MKVQKHRFLIRHLVSHLRFVYSSMPILLMQKKEPVGEDETLPAEAQNLESLTAETLSVQLTLL